MFQPKDEDVPIQEPDPSDPTGSAIASQNAETLNVTGMIFDELASPSCLSFHSNSSQTLGKQYKSVSCASSGSVNQAYAPVDIAMHTQKVVDKVTLPNSASNNSVILDAGSDSINNSSGGKVVFVPSQMIQVLPSASSSSLQNDASSAFEVDSTTCGAILHKVCEILSSYSRDIEYKVASGACRVDGVIFMSDHKSVFFMICVTPCVESVDATGSNASSRNRIEFVRKSGDSNTFVRFWCDIKHLYLHGARCILEPIQLRRLESTSQSTVALELDEFNEDMNNDDEFMQEFMRIFIADRLGNQVKESDVIKHDDIMRTIVCKTLYDADMSIVRGALIILILLLEKCGPQDVATVLIQQHGAALLHAMLAALNHQSVLIQSYAIKLLYRLSDFSSLNTVVEQHSHVKQALVNVCHKLQKNQRVSQEGTQAKCSGNESGTVSAKMLSKIQQTILK